VERKVAEWKMNAWTLELSSKSTQVYIPPIRITDYSYMCTRFPTIFYWSFYFCVGIANLQFRGRGVGSRESSERALVSSYRSSILFVYQHSFSRNFRLEFWVLVANPQSFGDEAVRGRRWYRSKEHWWTTGRVPIGAPL